MQVETLLPNMSGKINFIGEPVKSIGYISHKTNKRSMSIAIHTLNFVGRFILEGTLKQNPEKDSDWFNISLKDNLPYIEYNDYSHYNANVIRKNEIYTLKGNYTWLRAKMDREYLGIIRTPVPPYDLHANPVITGRVNMDMGISSTPYKSSLNPQYDPIYYDGWTPDYDLAHNRRMELSKTGNIEKVMLCY